MRAEIIAVGTELLLGDIVNTNAQFLARELAALGYTVYYQTVVGDNELRLRTLVNEAKRRSEVLIFTGGLGPTEDDLTKETVADAFGDTLVLDDDELAKMEQFFKGLGRQMTENNIKQAMVPSHGRKIPNDNGTAPGAVFRQQNSYAFLLPGPPGEMVPMFRDYVRPVLEQMQQAAIRSVVLRTFGIGESDLETRLGDLLHSENPTAALYAKVGEVHIRITARAETADGAEVMCAEYADLFRKQLKDNIYAEGEEELEATVVRLLKQKGESIATAESCTGGMLGDRITSVPGASEVYGFGAITYSNRAKHAMLGVAKPALRRYGAVSSQVAAQMAKGAAKNGDASYGVGITGIAGPAGGSAKKPVGLVYVAVAYKSKVHIRRLNIPGRNRDYVRRLASSNALDMVRWLASGLAIPGAKSFATGELPDFERAGKPQKATAPIVRTVVALAVALALVAGIIGGVWLWQRQGSRQRPEALSSLDEYQYGSEAYIQQAQEIIAEQAQQNPSVVGMVALADGPFERLILRIDGAQHKLLNHGEEPDSDNMGYIAKQAPAAEAGANVLLQGDAALAPLADYRKTASAEKLSTFTYVTAEDSRVYRLFAVLELGEEEQADGFDPAADELGDYQQFLTYYLGALARSLYRFDVRVSEADSFMTLLVPAARGAHGRLLLCGVLQQPGDEQAGEGHPPVEAAAPLMPGAYYEANGEKTPSATGVYANWLAWYLNRDASNTLLQMDAGLPAADSAVLAGAAGNSTSASESDTPAFPNPGELTVTLNGRVVTDSTENILARICQKELPWADDAAIQALAVAAHGWIRSQQLAGNPAPAVVGEQPSVVVLRAVKPVANIVLSTDGKGPAFTPFYTSAAEATNTAEALWGTGRDYLPTVSSPYDRDTDGWRQLLAVPADVFAEEVRSGFGIELGDIEDPGEWVQDVQKNEGGYVTGLMLGENTLSGSAFWRGFTDKSGYPLLQSPAFDVAFDGENFLFTVYGRGHGSGLSAAGAAALAGQGQDYQQILSHYFPGTRTLRWE